MAGDYVIHDNTIDNVVRPKRATSRDGIISLDGNDVNELTARDEQHDRIKKSRRLIDKLIELETIRLPTRKKMQMTTQNENFDSGNSSKSGNITVPGISNDETINEKTDEYT